MGRLPLLIDLSQTIMTRNVDLVLEGAIPADIAENLSDFFPEFGDLSYEEIIQHQESVYQSLQAFDRNQDPRSSYYRQNNEKSQFSGQEGESSHRGSFDSHLALDEALARSLQEAEERLDDLNVSQSTSTATENGEVSPGETPTAPVNQNLTEDDIDPDNMTHEQLQSLGEYVGMESKGLSEDLISSLPNYKYKSGMFSKKKEKQECVICFTVYKNGDRLSTLPCAHQYHSKCITPWLQLSKNCPVCKKEVSED